MWQRHWSLARDPFDDRRPSFVSTPTHDEAVARLVHTIESGGRSARLVAGPGLGKSTVLRRAMEATRSPTRRFARASGLADGPCLLSSLATGLGARVARESSRTEVWRALVDSARLCRWQGLQIVIAVDDCQALGSGVDRLDLERLEHLDPDPAARLSVIRVGRPAILDEAGPALAGWGLSIRLMPLTRGEAARYLAARLEAAGRPDPTYTPRALTRLHFLSGGVPRGLDRLARLAMMAGAVRGLEVIPPEVVDAAARECLDDLDVRQPA
jgi:type II secretory pathway predicted ATPase ExeA